jgi:hypothetical protein
LDLCKFYNSKKKYATTSPKESATGAAKLTLVNEDIKELIKRKKSANIAMRVYIYIYMLWVFDSTAEFDEGVPGAILQKVNAC